MLGNEGFTVRRLALPVLEFSPKIGPQRSCLSTMIGIVAVGGTILYERT